MDLPPLLKGCPLMTDSCRRPRPPGQLDGAPVCEKITCAGKALSAVLVTVLLCLAAITDVIVASNAPAYRVALEHPCLFHADLRSVLRPVGALLVAFLLGSFTHYINSDLCHCRQPPLQRQG
ncbi:hypothetical protein TRIUR3_24862 [Triticum urartu]|uniref:Uncharacterized protein n=1 Tax=Triticum urartu TaxID=4572 RepID=M7YPR1_TRIUA|nr:hypothetical protein TRIUR3_24862 [Triticum urartu]